MSQESPPELLVFEVSGLNFSVPLAVVEEVVPSNAITRIPNSPPFLLGLSAVRGKVMGVIDAARRYGLPKSLNSYFMVCHVRGNLTAVTIDRPIYAGALELRALDDVELDLLRSRSKVDPKFVTGGYEVLEKVDESGLTRATGVTCLCVDPDLFVSAEMASRVGEAA
jgi:chemotaxis signal transduction protein